MGAERARSCAARRGFNGAMAVRPWMAASENPDMRGAKLLQWGHGREAMDGFQHALDERVRPDASMGPWP